MFINLLLKIVHNKCTINSCLSYICQNLRCPSVLEYIFVTIFLIIHAIISIKQYAQGRVPHTGWTITKI